MKCRVTVSFILDEEEADMAEIELESQLSDLMENSRTNIMFFDIIDVQELEEEDDE
jgi:hypothetical protein